MSDDEKQGQERFGGRKRNRYSWPPREETTTEDQQTSNENDSNSEGE